MRILRRHTAVPAGLRGAAVALGNFDGMHRGHRSVIETAQARARALGAPAGVVTFEPHPRSHFAGDAAPFRLTPFRQKARLLADMGLDLMANLAFGPGLAGRLAQDFVIEVLVEGLGVSHVVAGPGFVFGRGRRGDGYVLARMAEREGFGYTEAQACVHKGRKVSSTDIRVLLRRGLVAAAADLLGRPWEHEGRVLPGERRGREMGFPTANLALDGALHPAPGIYAVRAGFADGGAAVWRDGAAYIGARPTFAGETVLLETHLFDFSGDLYGKRLRVVFFDRVRKDMAFPGAEALARQIGKDCNRAREILAGTDAGRAGFPDGSP